jgi:hypothetical protein
MERNMTEMTHTSDVLRETARGARSEVKDLAQQASQQAKQQAQHFAEERKGTVAESISGVARALQSTATSLEGEQQDMFARAAYDAASKLQSFSASLRDKDLDGIRRDTEELARTRPALFIGGCVAIGFALSRFFKASASRPGSSPGSSPEAPVSTVGSSAHDFDTMNAADPAIGLGSETSFNEPAREPVSSEWSADRIEGSNVAVSSDQEWKP